ncbi:hypothetical protein HanOQP8_Chr10g0347971 [Helianthus annuus]|nr:hypothetical protein HanOQP8_Chr10g0347971 [Helianthus annuus]KAJ0829136.1 hypothetical protein HanLR1_Chr00c0034g0695541 [Helianthus annuus]
MPENSSIGGLIPPPIPPKPPIPPDLPLSLSDSSNSLKFSPQLECETQKESTLQPSLECAALKAIHEGTLVASNHEKSVPNHPDLGNNRTDSSTIETSTRLSTEFQASTRVIEDLGIHQGCDDVYSGMCAPPKPISSSPKRGSRSLRKQGTKSGSGDPELDELRANLVAHDAQLQLEADKANGIRRTTRSCSKKNPVQIAGFGAVRKQKKSVKFSPMLSDLRANEFVKTTHHLINRNQQGCSAGDNLDNLTGEHQQDLGFNNSGVAADISVSMQMEKSQEVTTDMDKETAATGTASLQRHLGNNNSMPNATAQRNPQQSLGAATLNSGSSSKEVGNVWKKQSATGLSYADQMRLNNAAGNIRLEYIPPVITPEAKSWMFGSYFGLFVHVVSLLPRYPAVRPKCWVGREAQVLGGQPVSSGFIQHLALLIPWSDQPLSYLVIVPIRKAQIWVKVFKFAGCTKAQTFKSCKFHQWVWACTLAAIDWKAQLRVLHHSAIKAQSIWVSEFVGVRLVYAFCNVVRVLLGKISFLLGWSNLVGFICFLLGRPPKHVLVSCS